MNITKVVLRKLKMDLVTPFQTSFGKQTSRELLIVEAHGDKQIGYAECVSLKEPLYSEETVETSLHLLEDFLIPLVYENKIEKPQDVSEIFKPIRGNNMAKASIEGAIWDLYAKESNMSLVTAIGGEKKEIEVGLSIGIKDSLEELLEIIEEAVEEGYKRMKLKIKPGRDVEVLRTVRNRFPNTQIMADANSAYTLDDIDIFKELDDLNLSMIEQPLAHDDIIDHGKLQAEIKTPICLDESIHSLEDAKKAIDLGSCKIINLKIGRVGGITESIKIHDYCKRRNIPLWCGGMLETGIGRAHNIAITTLPNFTLPGDTAASARYWYNDIIEPEVTVKNGMIKVSNKAGIGYRPIKEIIEKKTIKMKEILP